MPLEIREVKTKSQLKEYICLPAKIHKNHLNWLPPLYIDEQAYYNPKKNKSFAYCGTIMLLAYNDNVPVGRIFGIINKRYNELHNEQHARFNFFEAYEDRNIVHALISSVEKWAKQKGMVKLIGPFGFSDKDPEGFIIEGFEHIPLLVTACNFPFMPEMLVREGYVKKVDCVDYRINIKEADFDVYHRILQRFDTEHKYNIIEFTNRKDLKPYIHDVFKLMNDCYTEIYGYVPLTNEEMDELARRYLPIINPQYVKLITKDNEVLSFVIAIPNMSKGIIKSKGKLLPFGIFHILQAAKTTKQLDLMLGGIKESCRGLGLDVIMGIKLLDSCRKNGIETIESHLILETNTKMRAEVEHIGGKILKRFRIFEKQLL